ncbi:cohesin subunit SA-2 isoform X1 [Alosa alosa]|uniref:cohesin subunit SA-2 isoform X1 n=1 Tax=Alosa alosa TaxID=278164 RepID=UPI0020150F4D|nr:cohesin subunit SA-2 isoform X1 [Alosa alosa]
MIAEPTLINKPSVQNENEIVDLNSSGAVNRASGGRNENRQKSVRGKRKAREGVENAKRKHPRTSNGGLGRAENGRPNKRDMESVTLFEVVTMGRGAIQNDPSPLSPCVLLAQAVVDDWIEAYVMDRDTALLDLISFFIQCSGCKGLVTAEMFQSRDIDVMSKMVEDLDEGSGLQYKRFMAFPWILTVTWPMDVDSGEYPLIITTQYWKRFRSQFCEFVSVLVARCQNCIIFDGYLMSTLISLLTELSDSRLRAFRHTCTLAAVKLLSALVSLSVNVDNSQKLLEVERSKYPGRNASPRLERIQRKVLELQERKLELENMMDAIFKGVFLKRYRDVVAEIRAVCMEELTVWMRLYGSLFLNDSYLKYVGWMLHDKQPDVRLKCALGLQGLYLEENLSLKMDLFTIRFKERMLSMVLDKDHEVAMQAMKLLMSVSKYCDDAFSQDDFKHMFQFVYSSNRPLAAAAGEILYCRLLVEPDVLTREGATGAERHRDLTLARVRALMHFSEESELHEHVVYLVDSLWECGGAVLRDWASLTSLLLQPSPPSSSSPAAQEQVVSPAELRFVLEVLLASVRQAAEGPPLAGRATGKKVIGAKDKKSQQDECVGLTAHLLRVLPQLLCKYSEDVQMMTSLLKIPQYFQVITSGEEHSEAVQGLLARMEAAVSGHTDQALLEAAARSYLALSSEESPWHDHVIPVMDQLIQRWTAHLGTLLEDVLKEGHFTEDKEKAEEILSTLRKLTAFHNGQHMSKWGLHDQVSKLLIAETKHGGLPAEVVVEALRCVGLSILWKLHSFGEVAASREAVIRQRTQLRAFCEKCHRCLTHMEQQVREQAFVSLCDVLVAHNYQLQVWEPASGTPLLLYAPDPKLQKALVTFILDHVFTGAETDGHSTRVSGLDTECGSTRLEDLHKRRNLLAAYCKLIVTSVLEMSMAAEIFKQYMKYYSDFGDIIKETLNRTRQMDKIESARTLMLCLQQLYLRLKQEQEGGSTGRRSDVQTYSSIKELARRFSLTFGWDQIKSRESLAMIHRDGVDFVFQGFVQQAERHAPPNITYLTILSEFSSKLLKPDKKTVYSYLQKYAGEHTVNNREECWKPLIYYRASLQATAEGDDTVSYISSDSNRPSLSSHSRCPSVRHTASDGEMKTSTPLPCIETKGTRPTQRPLSSPIERKEVEQRPVVGEEPVDSISQASEEPSVQIQQR